MLGILEFSTMSSQPLWGISIWNSRALVIASEAKQSLGILDLVLGILDFLGVRGCLLFGILEFLVNFLRNSRIYLRNSSFCLRILDLCSL